MTAPRKTTPRKAARPRAALPPPPVPALEGAAAPERSVKTIKLAGRDIQFYCPTMEQIGELEAVFKTFLETTQRGDADYPAIKSVIGPYYEQIYYLMVDPADEAWMREGTKRGYITVADPAVAGLVPEIIGMFKSEIEAWAEARMTRPQKRALARKRA